ncbi:MAG: cytochrome-c peroxidase [Flavobacteriales bacterium]|nr:cytochrome-c peroxidase [Flavobacteriales bacterium]
MNHAKSYLFILSGSFLFLIACGKKAAESTDLDAAQHAQYDEALKNKKLTYFQSLPDKAINPENPTSAAKVKLGHVLYYDVRLSKNNTISCNSCHNLSKAGVDNLPFSPGDDGSLGGRNSPTTLNAALHFKQFWDGRAKDVEEQAGMPILNPVEMAIPSQDFLVKRLSEVPIYKELFMKAFPNEKNPLTYSNIQKAIAAFERELLTPSRFDQYLKGDSRALTVQEKKGMLSFINIGCINCHSGTLLGGDQFQKFGAYVPYWELTGSKKIDKGLYEITKNEMDMYMFKVPSLRNVAETFPYFHDGSVKDLEQAVRIMGKAQLKYEMSDAEAQNIVAFLKSLSGEVPAFAKEVPKELASK